MHRHVRALIRTLLAVHLFLAGFALPGVAQTQKKEAPDLQRQREEWFYGQRAYPRKYIPAGARLKALKQLKQQLVDEAALKAQTPALSLGTNPSWHLIGPQPLDSPYGGFLPVLSGR